MYVLYISQINVLKTEIKIYKNFTCDENIAQTEIKVYKNITFKIFVEMKQMIQKEWLQNEKIWKLYKDLQKAEEKSDKFWHICG